MMLLQEHYAIIDFLNRGGPILYIILFFAFIMWVLILERFLYLYFTSNKESNKLVLIWNSYKSSEHSFKIREALKSQFSSKLNITLPVIKLFVSIVPLLGLLGTVSGMISIFDVISITGTGDAKAMAGGISMATLPTMSGMAIAIGGLFFYKKIEDIAHHKSIEFNKRLS